MIEVSFAPVLGKSGACRAQCLEVFFRHPDYLPPSIKHGPLAARAQQPAMPVIGYLSARSRDDTSHLIAAFQRGLAENGYVDGQNVTIEYRFALGEYDRLPAMAMEFARRPVAVIASSGGEPAAFAANTLHPDKTRHYVMAEC